MYCPSLLVSCSYCQLLSRIAAQITHYLPFKSTQPLYGFYYCSVRHFGQYDVNNPAEATPAPSMASGIMIHLLLQWLQEL